MQFSLLELSLNPDVQEKARQEIDRVLEKHNQQWTYEALQEMEYTDRVVLGKLLLFISFI